MDYAPSLPPECPSFFLDKLPGIRRKYQRQFFQCIATKRQPQNDCPLSFVFPQNAGFCILTPSHS
ncbi:hypothetical protein CLOSCI_03566 [[Clostridium] scindens ATCC 35704]|nr:hypothetical protein CLOSCI_03566 [[Clostridium] scindens ATCC 35704]